MVIAPFTELDSVSAELLRELAARWWDAPARPRVEPQVVAYWEGLVAAWVDDPTLPLLVRKAALKGAVIPHAATGRELLHVDNSPANWSLASALLGRRPTLDEVGAGLQEGAIPIAMVKLNVVDERSAYRGLLRANMDPPNLNTLGWKVCHALPVGTSDRTPAAKLPLETLKEHTRRLLSPANMFVVPKVYAGLGEVPEFITAFRASECYAGAGRDCYNICPVSPRPMSADSQLVGGHGVGFVVDRQAEDERGGAHLFSPSSPAARRRSAPLRSWRDCGREME